ncbi:DUF4314 domain-containing protein [Nocardia puris]|uniref:DUF4314 domain-containing protein n=1 Tax=Nocardia puris TaxID=208602 RepID=UPI0018930B3C|nr:DUF4314 domain-containing protein [Nocardia puris]
MTTPRVGDRIRITGLMPDDPAPPEIGTTGTVTRIPSSCPGQIFVDWDDGRALILLESDPFEILPTHSPSQPGDRGPALPGPAAAHTRISRRGPY